MQKHVPRRAYKGHIYSVSHNNHLGWRQVKRNATGGGEVGGEQDCRDGRVLGHSQPERILLRRGGGGGELRVSLDDRQRILLQVMRHLQEEAALEEDGG